MMIQVSSANKFAQLETNKSRSAKIYGKKKRIQRKNLRKIEEKNVQKQFNAPEINAFKFWYETSML